MPAAVAGPEIERLIQLLARLPGLGPRSARRAALHLIKKRELLMAPLAAALETAMEKIEICKICGNIDTQNPCAVCTDTRRDQSIIVVVADVADLWALERAHGDPLFLIVTGFSEGGDCFKWELGVDHQRRSTRKIKAAIGPGAIGERCLELVAVFRQPIPDYGFHLALPKCTARLLVAKHLL